jgi:glycosyltransferase involved in cell wall biosynthesis
MIEAGASTDGANRALVIVRNPATRDSRVLREAATLRGLGYSPLILAVTSEDEGRRHSMQDGIPLLRLSPTSPFPWVRRRLHGLSMGSSGGPGSPNAETRRAGSVARRRSSIRSLLVRLHRWIRTIDFYRQAIGIVRQTRPVLIHCNDYNTMWIGVAARIMGGAAVVYDTHELWPDRNLRPEPKWWLLVWESLFVRIADRTITASPGYASVMSRRYRIRPPRVVRNVPDIRLTAGPAPRTPVGETGRGEGATLAYIGALTRNRGLEVSIRALADLPGARLRLIGPVHASYRHVLEMRAQEQGVADRVEFKAPVPSSDVVSVLQSADVGLALIQPICLSYRLTLPNKLFEYVLAGIPVLGSDLPVIGGFIGEHGVGLTAGPADVQDVAEKLQEILRPERNREFRLAARMAAKTLRWETESDLLADTYKAAIAATAGR